MATETLSYILERRKAALRERAALDQELADLDAAERVERTRIARDAGSSQLALGVELQPPMPASEAAMTIKEMIALAIADAGPKGLTSPEIADEIKRRWLPTYKRENVSPKLTAMKHGGTVYAEQGRWKITDKGSAYIQKFRGQTANLTPSTDPAVGAG